MILNKTLTTATITTVLMPLSRLAGVSSFCSNLLSPFPSIVRILSFPAISFQIFLYALFPRFPWPTILPFPTYFDFHNLTYLGTNVSTHGMTIPPQTALNDHILSHHSNTRHITKNISHHPINQFHSTYHPDHTTLHPTQRRMIRMMCGVRANNLLRKIFIKNYK